jgi:hypothetical protein
MPTDIKTELAEATATRAQLERGLTAATSGGVAQQAIAQATQRAIAALERARAEAEQKKLDLEGRDTRLVAALKQRSAALTTVEEQFAAGKPLDPAATNAKDALKKVKGVADANPANADANLAKAVKAVNDLDQEVKKAETDLQVKKAALAAAEGAYRSAVATADQTSQAHEASAGSLQQQLPRVLALRARALELAAADKDDAATAAEALVTYADYKVALQQLTDAKDKKKADLEAEWTKAQADALTALAELLDKRVAAIESELELDTLQAKVATRQTRAAAAVTKALGL